MMNGQALMQFEFATTAIDLEGRESSALVAVFTRLSRRVIRPGVLRPG